MKSKLVLKTILLTLGVIVILALSVFGVASLLAPVTMMQFTDSLGLRAISGDYAYQEYLRSEDISYLSRAFLIAADVRSDETAAERFEELYARKEFPAYCEEQDNKVEKPGEMQGFSYRAYLCGIAAQVRYRLMRSEEEGDAVLAFAAEETGEDFPQGNPFVALTVAAAGEKDAAFCARIKAALEERSYPQNADLENIIAIREEVIHE